MSNELPASAVHKGTKTAFSGPLNSSGTDQTLRDSAYRTIWQRIVHLDYAPLTVLNEKSISAELGIGLSPVREALRWLEYDGLVMILPRRGTLTTEIGLSDVQSELEIRVELEGLAGRLAAQRGSAAEQEELSAHVQRMCDSNLSLADERHGFQTTDMDGEFHRLIYVQTRNKSLIRDLERHFAHALRIWFYCHRLRANLTEPDGYHELQVANYREVAHAIQIRDATRAEAAMRMHVMRDTQLVLSLLNKVK